VNPGEINGFLNKTDSSFKIHFHDVRSQKISDNDLSKKRHKKTGKVGMTMPVREFLSNSI